MSAGPELLDAELLERPSGAKKLSRILVNNNRYRYALLAAFVVCVVLSRLGASLVADGDWSYFNPGEAGPFRTAFAGAVLEIAFLPLAFALGGATTWSDGAAALRVTADVEAAVAAAAAQCAWFGSCGNKSGRV